MKTTPIQEDFPDAQTPYSFQCPSYEQLVASLGLETLLREADDGYSGSTYMIVREPDTDRVGFLTFSWGSCSGCDDVEGANTYEDAENIRAGLRDEINWAESRAALRAWIDTAAWDDAHRWGDAGAVFKAKALEMLPAICTLHDDCKMNDALAADCLKHGGR